MISGSAPIKPIFQSTPPVKAATCILLHRACAALISIHAAREGGDTYFLMATPGIKISIHAAREGGDIVPMLQIQRL